MRSEFTIDTTAEVEFDDEVVWEALKDRVVSEVESCLEDYSPWEHVEDEVAYLIDDRVSEIESGNDPDDHLHSLLDQFHTRLESGDNLCGLGKSAQKAILKVVEVGEPSNVVAISGEVDLSRVEGDLDVQHRLADLERQVKVLLSSIADLGERAASVTPNG